jgi:hypothetical protein
MDRHDREEGSDSGRVIVGLVIVALGTALLIERTGLADIHLDLGRYWPFILIVMGLARFADPPRRAGRGSRWSGGRLLWIGLWGLVSEFHVLGLDYATSWPLLVIGAGIGVVWRAFGEARMTGESHPVQRS